MVNQCFKAILVDSLCITNLRLCHMQILSFILLRKIQNENDCS